MATATGQMPSSITITRRVPAVSTAGNDADTAIGKAPFAGTITSVTYIPDTVLTGANTNYRTLRLRNKGAAGSGTTVIATKDFTSGVNIAAMDEGAITLSVTAADLDVAADDVLAWHSLHVASGLADPGGLVIVVISRA